MGRAAGSYLRDDTGSATLQALIARVRPGMSTGDFFRAVSMAFARAQAVIAPEDMLVLLRRNTTHRVFREALERVRAAVSPGSVLVLGCGEGYAGIDAGYAQSVAEEVFDGARVVRADLRPADILQPATEPAFDVVVSHSVAHFIPNLTDFFESYVGSRLKPGGYFVLGREPNARFWRNAECRHAVERMRRAEGRRKLLRRILSPRTYLSRLRYAPDSDRFTPLPEAVNTRLRREHGFREALTPVEINRIVDPHIPPDGAGLDIGYNGFDWDLLGERYLPGFRLAWTGASEHLGRRDPISRRWAQTKADLERWFPLDGCFFSAVWHKEPG